MTMTFGQIESSLQAAIAETVPDDGDHYVYVCDFSETFVIYCLNWDEYLQDDYTIDDDGNVTLTGSPITVKPLTTYVPTEQEAIARAAFETRGVIAATTRQHPEYKAAPAVIRSESLTYHRGSRHSYYRDLLLTDRVVGAEQRLRRHGQEMDVLAEERERRAWSEFRSGNFEYRVEPNTTDGQGGYFSPPAWLNELFATAKRPGRIISGLAPKFALPLGVSQVNQPIIATGTAVQANPQNAGVPTQDFTDQAGSSAVVTFVGDSDVSLQLLEQSPQGAHLDWAIFQDLSEAYDSDLETQLLYGLGSGSQQLAGIVPNATTTVTFTSASPTGSLMWTALSEAAAQLGDARDLPPEVWLLRTARWAWIQGSESTSGYPFGMSPFFLGMDDVTPNPIGGLMGWPVFLNDAITMTAVGTAYTGGTQDEAICFRPSDLVFLEGIPRTVVDTEVLSGSLGARIQMHNYVAAITRYTSGVAVVGGTGFVIQNGY